MHVTPVVAVVVGIACGLAAGSPCQAATVKLTAGERTAVQESAIAWLRLVDRGQYATSWDWGGSYFQSHMNADEWKRTLEKWRTPLGEVVARKLKRVSASMTDKVTPPAKSARIVYETIFGKDVKAYEILIYYHESDGEWRMNGYFIERAKAKAAPAAPEASKAAPAAPPDHQPAPAGKITILNPRDKP